jgi:hypothetical protein
MRLFAKVAGKYQVDLIGRETPSRVCDAIKTGRLRYRYIEGAADSRIVLTLESSQRLHQILRRGLEASLVASAMLIVLEVSRLTAHIFKTFSEGS